MKGEKRFCVVWITVMLASIVFFAQANAQAASWAYGTQSDSTAQSSIPPISDPVLGHDGTVYFGMGTNQYVAGGLYALKPDGTFKWRSNVTSSACDPAVAADGTIYIGSDEGYLYAVKPDGSLKWKFYTGNNTDAWNGSKALIAADGTIYIAECIHHDLYAVNPDGTLKWKAAGVADPGSGMAIGPDGTIYCGDTFSVRAINLDGSLKWEAPNIDQGGNGNPHFALGSDGTIYVAIQWHLFALNPDGSQKWDYSGSLFYSAPSVGADGTIYAACGSPDRLLALNPDGSLKWQHMFTYFYNGFWLGGIHAEWSPAVGADGSIYVGADMLDPNNPNQTYLVSLSPNGTMNWSINVSNIWNGFGNRQGHGGNIGPDGTIYFSTSRVVYAFATDSKGPANSSWPMYCHDSQRTGRLVLPSTYPISGRITSHGSGLAGVSINLEGTQGPGPWRGFFSGLLNRTTTDKNGDYSFPGLKNGSYTVTPTLTGYTFSPGSAGVAVNGGNATVEDIAATLDTVDGTEKWNSPTGPSPTTQPALALDGTIYVGFTNGPPPGIDAFNPDGSLKWNYQTPNGCDIAGISVGSDGTIYLEDNCGGGLGSALRAVEPNGAPKWTYPVQVHSANPSIASDGTIYVLENTDPSKVNTEMSVVAVNPNGSKKWSSAVIEGRQNSSPAVGPDGTIYFSADNYPSQQGNNRFGLYAVDPLNGGVKWRFATGDNLTEPTFGSDGTIYVGSGGTCFYAINPDGKLKWQIGSPGEANIGNYQTWSPVIGADGTIYFASGTGDLLAFNPDGSNKWRINNTYSISFAWGVPAIGLDGTVYASGYTLMAVDPVDGTTRWNHGLPYQNPTGGIFIGNDGTLYLNSKGLLAVNSGSMGLAKAPWPTLCHDNQHTCNYNYVEPKEMTITADNQSVTYGGPLPPLTYKVSPSVQLKTAPSCVSSADGRSNAGDYPGAVTCSGASADGYWVKYVSGDMTVNPATLTVTADNQSMNQGGPLPTFTFGYSGFVNGDTQAVLKGAPSLSTTATAASPAGQYPIIVGQGTLQAANYVFNLVNGTLTILGLRVDRPSAGEIWAVGTKQTITWSFWGNPGSTVDIELLNKGKAVQSIAHGVSSGSGGSGSYAWKIPSGLSPGSNYQVRVTSKTNTAFTAASQSTFTIKGISIAVTSPGVGETWAAGEQQTITWSYWGNPRSAVKIQLVKGSAVIATIAPSVSIGSGGTGSYAWTISSALASGSDYRVRVTSKTNSTYTAVSQGTFTINGASIAVTSPGGGENWAAGSKQTITWSYSDNPGPKVNLELLNKGKAVATIKSGVSIGSGGDGSYVWTIPSKLAHGSNYQVQVKSTTNSFCKTVSSSFTINGVKTSAGPDEAR